MTLHCIDNIIYEFWSQSVSHLSNLSSQSLECTFSYVKNKSDIGGRFINFMCI